MKRTVELTADWEVEYDFGSGLFARIRSLLFHLATRNAERTLVRLGPVAGGAQAIADALAVESSSPPAGRGHEDGRAGVLGQLDRPS